MQIFRNVIFGLSSKISMHNSQTDKKTATISEAEKNYFFSQCHLSNINEY